MATLPIRLTQQWQDIADGAARVIVQHRGAGSVEIFYGAAPAASARGIVVSGASGINGTGGYFDLPATEGLYARAEASYGSNIEIVVIQIAAPG